MKKLYALLLAGIMIFSLAACGGGEEEAADNGQQTTVAANANSSGENNKKGKEWPTDKVAAWSGSGKIVDVSDNSSYAKDYTGYYIVYIDAATLDEFTAYISTLKSAGYSYSSSEGEEPSAGYKEDIYFYTWNGTTSEDSRAKVTLYKNEKEGLSDSMSVYKYVLEIAVWIK